MKYRVIITQTFRLKSGLLQTITKHVKGSKTMAFNAIAEALQECHYDDREMVDVTVVFKEKGGL